ncbi:hypothetical protein BOX15_Mlig002147g8 [Macrostomum lignano]|uniref:Otopetrin n=1 Tax=Macrostomum lignano TaxID=282301 RepID=A0A267EZX3_9PLAT|nr:hypothetical protein BOX15_Mlig002147g8 [Macrostomum lignano]
MKLNQLSLRPNGSSSATAGQSTLAGQKQKRMSLNRPENASRLACYYAMFLTLCGLVLTICVLEHTNNSRFSQAAQWTQLVFFLCVLTVALAFLFWLMGHVMRLPPQAVPQRQIREFRGRANSISVYAGGCATAPAASTTSAAVPGQSVYMGRRNSDDMHVYDNFRDPKYTVPEASPEEEERGDQDDDVETEAAAGGKAEGNDSGGGGVGNAAYVVDEDATAPTRSIVESSSSSSALTATTTVSSSPSPAPAASMRRLQMQLPKPRPPSAPSTLSPTLSRSEQQLHRKHRLNTITINSALDLHITEIPPYTVLTKGEAHSPSFFLRIAAIVFGCAGVVNMLVKAVDALLGLSSSKSQALEVFTVLRCLVNIAFNCVQTFFLFKYSKISIAYRQKACLFGLMHLLATNLCLWIGDLGEEKLHKYHKLYSGAKNGSSGKHSGSLSSLMSPYLYPFNIEYSLMAAFFCHALFRNVGTFISLLEGRGLHVERKSLSMRNRTKTRFSVSCHKSTKGLLLGMGLVLAVVCVSAYVLNLEEVKGSRADDSRKEKRLIISSVMLTLQAVLLAMVIPVVMALRRLPSQQQQCPVGHSEQHCSGGALADKLMLQLGLAAVIVSQLYVLLEVAASCSTDKPIVDQAGLAIRVCEALAIMLQSALQVLVLDLGLERSFHLAPPISQGLVTALIPANLAVWVLYTLTGPVSSLDQSETSRVISALCLPVTIFFRFHSVGCFAELWKILQRASENNEVAFELSGGVISTVTGR